MIKTLKDEDQNSNRCLVEESKRRLVVHNDPPVREIEPVIERGRTPAWLVNVMSEVNEADAKLILVKKNGFTMTDVAKGQTRLLMPWKQIKDKDFLTQEELKIIDEHFHKKREKGVEVILVDSRAQNWKLNLRRWDMNTSSNYVLVSGWSNVVSSNKLKRGHMAHIWSFHSPDKLYFALVPPDPAPAPALVPALVPAPALALVSVQALAQVPVQTLAQVPATTASAPARDSDELHISEASLGAEEDINMEKCLLNFPKRWRTLAVPVPSHILASFPSTRDSGNLGRIIPKNLELFNILAERCVADMACLEAERCVADMACLEAAKDTTRRSSQVSVKEDDVETPTPAVT